jgi:diadenosine tetraphosphate (Ap4A) HIT family hydrolase
MGMARAETGTLDEFREKFRVAELEILKNESWTWSIRPAQATLGAGILSLNRYAAKFSEVTPGEMADLGSIVGILETSIEAAFNHNIMNYLMLMMVDHHVHYHVIPRYDGVRMFAGLEWVDTGWPALPEIGVNQHPGEPDLLQNLREKLASTLRA